jgi:hypothetical protein
MRGSPITTNLTNLHEFVLRPKMGAVEVDSWLLEETMACGTTIGCQWRAGGNVCHYQYTTLPRAVHRHPPWA